jgi:MerR family transcriptional regulator, light-induced transcriptional regulator
MYEIGQLWSENRLDIATEHICSNTAQSLTDIINNQHLKKYLHAVRILIFTPSGELHSLACKVIESILISKGFKVFNIPPSVQADSITRYIKDKKPNTIFISITLDENIKLEEC